MCNIQVTAAYDWLIVLYFQVLQILHEVNIPLFHSVVQSLQPVYSCIRHVHSHQDELIELSSGHSALLVVLVDVYVSSHFDWLGSSVQRTHEDGRASIPFLRRLAAVPVLHVLGEVLLNLERDVVFLEH
jgi:hypothetical protein